MTAPTTAVPAAGPLAPLPPPVPRGAAARLRRSVADTWTLTLRTFRHWARQPGALLLTLLFPVLLVLMFGYLFGGQMRVPGGGGYREFLMPGMFAMTMVFGVESTFTAVAADAARGVTDRFRSLPIAPSAVVAGRCVADMLNTVAALAVMVVCGRLVGWNWHEGAARALGAFALLLALRFALLWVGIHLALVSGNPESVVAIQILVWPLGFLSNTFAAPESMPGWLGAIAAWNPLSATVAATRELFGNPGWGGDSFAARHAIELAVAWPVVITLVFLPAAVRKYARLDR
ncbi:ABC transporter permease [Yinghuangia sp. ASG 101]|uniref:ABC transporter permease n=1 Tax=Yinghuangia sp. ASG 101 TaxID=2896848 RepID=UPI001E60E7EF|nr:ABC transporter permease [Yinghuangia sp. ASG 101]UGQ13035.1 ABC transporter permease [Yinghuangia sp. ASG 101]